MNNLPESVIHLMARQTRARNMARLRSTSRTQRATWNIELRRRRRETRRRVATLQERAQTVGARRIQNGRRRYPLWQSAIYKALVNLEKRWRLNLTNLKRKVYTRNANENSSSFKAGQWFVNAYNFNAHGRPREIFVHNNARGVSYPLTWNPYDKRYTN